MNYLLKNQSWYPFKLYLILFLIPIIL
jgi:hypothetical protein